MPPVAPLCFVFAGCVCILCLLFSSRRRATRRLPLSRAQCSRHHRTGAPATVANVLYMELRSSSVRALHCWFIPFIRCLNPLVRQRDACALARLRRPCAWYSLRHVPARAPSDPSAALRRCRPSVARAACVSPYFNRFCCLDLPPDESVTVRRSLVCSLVYCYRAARPPLGFLLSPSVVRFSGAASPSVLPAHGHVATARQRLSRTSAAAAFRPPFAWYPLFIRSAAAALGDPASLARSSAAAAARCCLAAHSVRAVRVPAFVSPVPVPLHRLCPRD